MGINVTNTLKGKDTIPLIFAAFFNFDVYLSR